MVMGALWAKQAWGDYWSWDPKETWAAATWFSYLLYLHLRQRVKDTDVLFAVSIFSFLLLQMCWWGINYLPSAQGMSVHTY
jgi:ABC-type transport system involved in cytochrome c biogenesis permease subunit